MSARMDNSGPAFPRAPIGEDCNSPYGHQDGMTLRDWFAGQALAGLAGMTVSDGSDFLHSAGTKSAAHWAYSFADAMIAARKGGAA